MGDAANVGEDDAVVEPSTDSVEEVSALLEELLSVDDDQDAVDQDINEVCRDVETSRSVDSAQDTFADQARLLWNYHGQPPEVQEVMLDLARIPVRHQDNEDRLVDEATATAEVDRKRRESMAKSDSSRTNYVLAFVTVVWAASFAASVYFFYMGNNIAGALFFGGPFFVFIGNVIVKIVATRSGD